MTVEHGSSLDDVETTDRTESPSAGSARAGRLATIKLWAGRCAARWRSIVATALVAGAVGVTVSLYFVLYRPDQRVGDAAAHRAVQAASDGAAAVLSYAPESLNFGHHRPLFGRAQHHEPPALRVGAGGCPPGGPEAARQRRIVHRFVGEAPDGAGGRHHFPDVSGCLSHCLSSPFPGHPKTYYRPPQAN